MYLRLFRAAAVAAVLGWIGMSAEAQTGAPTAKDPVVARVNGVEIKRSDLVSAQQDLPAQYRQKPLQSMTEPLQQALRGARSCMSLPASSVMAVTARVGKMHRHWQPVSPQLILRWSYSKDEMQCRDLKTR